MGRDLFNGAGLQNGLFYVGQGWTGPLNQSISIFDTRGPHPMKMVGHFAAPGASVVCPLPDGWAIVGGSKVWVVGPPPVSR